MTVGREGPENALVGQVEKGGEEFKVVKGRVPENADLYGHGNAAKIPSAGFPAGGRHPRAGKT